MSQIFGFVDIPDRSIIVDVDNAKKLITRLQQAIEDTQEQECGQCCLIYEINQPCPNDSFAIFVDYQHEYYNETITEKITDLQQQIDNLPQYSNATIKEEPMPIFNGKDCVCAAYDRSECGCGASWVSKEHHDLKNKIEELELKIKQQSKYIELLENRNQELLGMYNGDYDCKSNNKEI